MKILELKLKKDVIIIDTNAPIEAIEIDDYEFLCKGSELTEEIASELVEEHYMNGIRSYEIYNDYRYNDSRWLDNALDSFISAVESKGFYWLENPIEKPFKLHYLGEQMVAKYQYERDLRQWQETEEKTFKNPLIFVKK